MFVVQFLEDVKRNNFFAELVVFSLTTTEDVFLEVHISIWPVDLFVGLLRART